uniref:Transmembrane protein n=1 Tax=Chromera velia CCMP2878 TaxID=1169474 RepID=A0A0G4HAV7_9ALVE|eukprot:Cvel_6132.t1-p1 / transcript=Cvel_6132.t1 / gene=Cvel_6132 / organism=Chromera_velia_CCMP2878 / gene_product=hypothetical protein / transcript_product=hypothetical protein / location=Cvel_scaffold296:47001-48812(-) / protein_length=604 / sequence_SO=supercontig / SO=protein_coding / is_pseudo=false
MGISTPMRVVLLCAAAVILVVGNFIFLQAYRKDLLTGLRHLSVSVRDRTDASARATHAQQLHERAISLRQRAAALKGNSAPSTVGDSSDSHWVEDTAETAAAVAAAAAFVALMPEVAGAVAAGAVADEAVAGAVGTEVAGAGAEAAGGTAGAEVGGETAGATTGETAGAEGGETAGGSQGGKVGEETDKEAGSGTEAEPQTAEEAEKESEESEEEAEKEKKMAKEEGERANEEKSLSQIVFSSSASQLVTTALAVGLASVLLVASLLLYPLFPAAAGAAASSASSSSSLWSSLQWLFTRRGVTEPLLGDGMSAGETGDAKRKLLWLRFGECLAHWVGWGVLVGILTVRKCVGDVEDEEGAGRNSWSGDVKWALFLFAFVLVFDILVFAIRVGRSWAYRQEPVGEGVGASGCCGFRRETRLFVGDLLLECLKNFLLVFVWAVFCSSTLCPHSTTDTAASVQSFSSEISSRDHAVGSAVMKLEAVDLHSVLLVQPEGEQGEGEAAFGLSVVMTWPIVTACACICALLVLLVCIGMAVGRQCRLTERPHRSVALLLGAPSEKLSFYRVWWLRVETVVFLACVLFSFCFWTVHWPLHGKLQKWAGGGF